MSVLRKKLRDAAKDVVDSLFTEAADEATELRLKDAKDRIKYKLRCLQAAKLVVANIERELDDLRIELEETL